MNKHVQLIRFAETAKGFDSNQRIKLVLFTLGIKQNTYVILKISPENLEEKHHFEQHLKNLNILHHVGRPRSYEEIKAIRGNAVIWKMNGVWYGYDLFKNKKSRHTFYRYKKLLRQKKHEQADAIAGKLYGYPACCTREYTKEHDIEYIKKKYTYHHYYQRLRETTKKFPFVLHYPCRPFCPKTKKLNTYYAHVLQKHAPHFWKQHTTMITITTDLIVDSESDIYDDFGQSLWPARTAHEYSFITKKPINQHYYILTHLTEQSFIKGNVANAQIRIRHDFPEITLRAIKKSINNLYHTRKFILP